MTRDEALAWIAEAERRARLRFERAKSSLTITQKVRAWRFPAQARFADDPAKRKTARKGRRSGGSEGIATILLEVADTKPRVVCPYVTLTKDTARRILWPKLKRLDRELDLKLGWNETRLEAYLPNGSTIWLTGADKADEIEKLRGGDQGHPIIAIDEAQAFGPFLKELVEEVADAAVAEHDGTILLCGTPNASCAGYFFDADQSKNGVQGYSNHHWTLLDNPFFLGGRGKEFLEAKKREKGWTDETPTYRREYLGLWHRSDEDLVYAFNEDLNLYNGVLPLGVDWRHVLGVDIGFDDSFSYRAWAYAPDHPDLYETDFYDAKGLIPALMAKSLQEIRARRTFTKIRIDQGGLGKAIAEEFRTRYSIPCEAAEKSKKREFIQLMNGDFRAGRIKVLESDKVYRGQLQHLQWDESKMHEDPRFPNDACDGGLYGWREARHYMFREKPADPVPGSPEYYEAEERRIEEEMERDARREAWESSWDE